MKNESNYVGLEVMMWNNSERLFWGRKKVRYRNFQSFQRAKRSVRDTCVLPNFILLVKKELRN